MRCSKCTAEAKTNFIHLGKLCPDCYCHSIEKRIRKEARTNKVFSKNDRIIAVGKLNQYLIPRIIEGLPAEILFAKRPGRGKNIVLRTADDVACDMLQSVLSNKKIKQNHISIVRSCTDEELEQFCKFRRISFKPNRKNDEIMNILDSLEKKHPETKFSVAKTEEKLKKLINQRL